MTGTKVSVLPALDNSLRTIEPVTLWDSRDLIILLFRIREKIFDLADRVLA